MYIILCYFWKESASCLFICSDFTQSGETPTPPPTLLHGIGIPMEMVSAATRSTPLLYDRKHINMPNTNSTCFFFFFFFNTTAIQWKQQSLLHYSHLVQGFRFFCNLVNMMYITEMWICICSESTKKVVLQVCGLRKKKLKRKKNLPPSCFILILYFFFKFFLMYVCVWLSMRVSVRVSVINTVYPVFPKME